MRRAAIGCLMCLTAVAAHAQAPPALVINAAPELSAARARLDSYDLRPLSAIVRLVGLSAPGPPIQVVLAGEDSAVAREMPPWTAGFAIGNQSLIVLFPARSPAYPHDSLEDVLRHEVAHVLISRAAGGRRVPRWFHEGLAVAVERPWSLPDRSRLAVELLFGPRLTLREIDRLFSGNQSTQSRAYSLSAAVVRDLMTQHGAAAPSAILAHVAAGLSFDDAVARVAVRTLYLVESDFWSRQRTWTLWIPLLTSGSVMWMGVMGLAAFAAHRRRKKSAEIRTRWAAEEAAVASAAEDADSPTTPTTTGDDDRA